MTGGHPLVQSTRINTRSETTYEHHKHEVTYEIKFT